MCCPDARTESSCLGLVLRQTVVSSMGMALVSMALHVYTSAMMMIAAYHRWVPGSRRAVSLTEEGGKQRWGRRHCHGLDVAGDMP